MRRFFWTRKVPSPLTVLVEIDEDPYPATSAPAPPTSPPKESTWNGDDTHWCAQHYAWHPQDFVCARPQPKTSPFQKPVIQVPRGKISRVLPA